MIARIATAAGILTVAGMEACWLASVLWLLDQRAAGGMLPLLPWTLAGALPAYALARAARALAPVRRLALLLGAAGLWGAAWMTSSLSGLMRFGESEAAAWVVPAAAGIAWGAGTRLAFVAGSTALVLGEFQFGLMALVIVFFSAAQWGLTLPQAGFTGASFFLLFFCGAALTHGSAPGGWLKSSSRGQWLAILFGHALLMLAAGALLVQAMTPGLLQTFLSILERLWEGMVGLLAAVLAWLARILPQPEIATSTPAPGGMATPPASASMPDLLRLPDYIRTIAQVLVGGFWAGLFLVALWRLASQVAAWLRQQLGSGAEETVESMPGALRDDLRRLLGRLWEWIGARVGGLGRWLPGGGPAGPASGAAAVRRRYRELLKWAARRGHRRRPAHTPREFLTDLCERFPLVRTELRLITEHYERVRYGEIDPGSGALSEIECCWERVRLSAGRKKAGPADRKQL